MAIGRPPLQHKYTPYLLLTQCNKWDWAQNIAVLSWFADRRIADSDVIRGARYVGVA